MTSLLREPLLHFLALGAALFGLFALVSDRSGGEPDRIVVTQGAVEHLRIGFSRTWQRPPTQLELEGLIDDYVREEIYAREAAAMRLDRGDTVVRRRLRQKMEFLTEEAAEPAPPTDDQLRAYLQEHPDRFRVEPRLSFRHVYLSRDRRGAAATRDAEALLARLAAAGPGADLAGLGDPLMIPDDLELSSRSEIARLFGEAFAARVVQLESGRWAGPVESGYGLHLVLVREREEGRLPGLDEVREDVEREWLAARRKESVEAAYQRLRERYTVFVERPEAADGEVASAQ